jgi:hypothetical protein
MFRFCMKVKSHKRYLRVVTVGLKVCCLVYKCGNLKYISEVRNLEMMKNATKFHFSDHFFFSFCVLELAQRIDSIPPRVSTIKLYTFVKRKPTCARSDIVFLALIMRSRQRNVVFFFIVEFRVVYPEYRNYRGG